MSAPGSQRATTPEIKNQGGKQYGMIACLKDGNTKNIKATRSKIVFGAGRFPMSLDIRATTTTKYADTSAASVRVIECDE